ncbi:MAG: glycine cleavage system protein GcvH [Propionibacterium sp.]|nr:glycine cleavage system protein GcvH [Propionibacterium sp.]
MIKYTQDHEWIAVTDDVATVGITQYAADELGDIVYIELPVAGQTVAKGEEIVVIESVKTASDITAPLDGEITAVNEAVATDPAMVNSDAMGAWFFRMTLANEGDVDDLLDEDAYQDLIS